MAYVDGDVVTDTVKRMIKSGKAFQHLVDDENHLSQDGDEIIFAQCYLGAMGIKRAFQEGADIVLCGRVADASPCVGAAAWWHDWKEDQFDELARALMAGHLIECTGYVTGANFTGFKRFPKNVKTGFPIGMSMLLDPDPNHGKRADNTFVTNSGDLIGWRRCHNEGQFLWS